MKRRARRIVLAAVALALLAAVPALAAQLTVISSKLTAWQSATTVPWCASPGTQTASADADSWINQASPTSNFATDALLNVRSQNGARNQRMITRFALPALPANCTVTLAILRLHASVSTAGRTLQALQVDAAWAENTVTWANQPGTTGTAATTTSALGYREWTVTTHVAAMYSGPNNGFLIRDATENNSTGPAQWFHSREMAPVNPPELVLTFG